MANYTRLYRSRTESMVAGLAGGLAEYFQVDPTLVRLGFAAACVLTAIVPVLLIYLAAWIIVPLEPRPLPERGTSPQPNAS